MKKFIFNIVLTASIIVVGFLFSAGILTDMSSGQSVVNAVGNQFIIGDAIKATAKVDVRGIPGLQNEIWGSQVSGSTGTIIDGPVFLDGYTWWRVNYRWAPDGWSVETYLETPT